MSFHSDFKKRDVCIILHVKNYNEKRLCYESVKAEIVAMRKDALIEYRAFDMRNRETISCYFRPIDWNSGLNIPLFMVSRLAIRRALDDLNIVAYAFE